MLKIKKMTNAHKITKRYWRNIEMKTENIKMKQFKMIITATPLYK